MNRREFIAMAACVTACVFSGRAEVVWTDGANLPVEGKAFAETPTPWSRLPARFKGKVSAATWGLMGQSAGLYYSFTTTASRVSVKWSLVAPPNVTPQMANVGSSGLDVYARQADGTWRHLAAGCPKGKDGNEMSFRPKPGAAHRVYLPLCNGVKALSFGVEEGKRLFPFNEHAGKKPIVVYGGSVVQGACVSRPGLAWTSQLGRLLDAPVVNLGCSGQGVMTDGDLEMLAETDAGGYVLMTLGNMKAETWLGTYERFVRTLESRKPRLPMVLCSWHYPTKGKCPQDAALEAMKLKLAREDGSVWDGMLHIVPNGDLCPPDGDSTVDGGHPNDYGARVMARAVASQAEVAFPKAKK